MAGWKISRLGGGVGEGSPTEQSISSSRTVRLGRVQPQAPGHRTVSCNDREANALAKYKGNSVSTTKYDALTFLPKGLFEQFRWVANLYFLMISILSCTPVSPVSPITNVLLLTLVLLVSLVKEAWEDWKRFQNDMAINNSSIEVLQDQKWVCIPCKKMQVGDVVKVKQDESFPADILFLPAQVLMGSAMLRLVVSALGHPTANLDGETNLKIRKVLEKTWDHVTPERVSEFKVGLNHEPDGNWSYEVSCQDAKTSSSLN